MIRGQFWFTGKTAAGAQPFGLAAAVEPPQNQGTRRPSAVTGSDERHPLAASPSALTYRQASEPT